jgi:hypothetical protein
MSTPPLGWIPPKDRSPQMQRIHDETMSRIIRHKFAIKGTPKSDPGPRVSLLSMWKHPQIVADISRAFTGFYQFTGSCVGVGGGNAIFSTIVFDILERNQAERAYIPWWPFTYGKSRFRLGDTRPGEGSLGSTFAEAAEQDGQFSKDEAGLEAMSFSDERGVCLSKDIEMKWSDGDDIPQQFNTIAAKHKCHVEAEIKRAEDLREAIRNYHACSFACNRYMNPDNCRIAGSGDNKVLLGSFDTNGGHQQSVQEWWDHPDLGPIGYVLNQWGDAYEIDPATGLRRGCWVKMENFQTTIRTQDAEVFPWTNVEGYPAQTLSWGDILRDFN